MSGTSPTSERLISPMPQNAQRLHSKPGFLGRETLRALHQKSPQLIKDVSLIYLGIVLVFSSFFIFQQMCETTLEVLVLGTVHFIAIGVCQHLLVHAAHEASH